MASAQSAKGTRAQLEEAHRLVLRDPILYRDIMPGILPLIEPNRAFEVRRWGADFLAEAFANPTLDAAEKQGLSIAVLDAVKTILESEEEDTGVLKSLVQASASLYLLVVQHIIDNPDDSATWDKMTAIKSRVLRLWDSATADVQVCCIKFVQRVIQVQTPGSPADSRHNSEQSEPFLELIPPSHPLIPSAKLEAEASGLLDRLLSIFQDNTSNALLVNAVLHCLGHLIRSRPTLSHKILSAVLSFSPWKHVNLPVTPKTKVLLRSIERTTRALLVNANKLNPNGPLAPRIHQHIEYLTRLRSDPSEEPNRKRGLPPEPTDGLDQAKRVRLGAEIKAEPDVQFEVASLPPGPVTLRQVFSLTKDEATNSFDVQQLPVELVQRVTIGVLEKIDDKRLHAAVQAVQSRLDSLPKIEIEPKLEPGPSDDTMDIEDDDEYEPTFEPAEDDEQIYNKMENESPEPDSEPAPGTGRLELPWPAPLDKYSCERHSKAAIGRVFRLMRSLPYPARSLGPPSGGLDHVAGANLDKNAWIVILARLATRPLRGLEDPTTAEGYATALKEQAQKADSKEFYQPDYIREQLYAYITEDFRKHTQAAVRWLHEEWFDDRIRKQGNQYALVKYERWALKVLDAMLPYLDAKDHKLFTRFMSEIPEVTPAIIERVKHLARDPERVSVAVNSLHYLVLYRPPVRRLCLDALEFIWKTHDYARASAAKVLMKYRPEALNTEVDQEVVIKTEDVQTEVVPTEAEQPKSWIMRYLDGEIDQSRTAHTPSQALRNLDDS